MSDSIQSHSASPTLANWRRRQRSRGQSVSGLITKFSGSMTFVLLHAAWFAAWIIVNLSLSQPFDAFPFGLLTLIVSLEAIFLSTFVLMSQNQQSAKDEARLNADLQTNVYAESIVELVAAKLNISTQQITARFEDSMRQAGSANTNSPHAPGTQPQTSAKGANFD